MLRQIHTLHFLFYYYLFIYFSFDSLEDSFDSLEDSFDSLEDSFDSLEDSFDSLEDSFDSLEDSFDSLEDSFDSLEDSFDWEWEMLENLSIVVNDFPVIYDKKQKDFHRKDIKINACKAVSKIFQNKYINGENK